MANKILNLIFKADATDATKELDKLKGTAGSTDTGAGGTGVLGVTSALKATITPALALGTSLMGVGVILKGELDKYTEYVTEVGNLASALNITTYEASLLKGHMEEYDISDNAMLLLFKNLVDEGIEPSLAGIRDILKEYDNLEGIEKGEFATRMFGSGQSRAEILGWWGSLTDLQRDGLTNQQLGLGVTEEMYTETLALQNATSLVTTEWVTLKGQLTQEVMPTLITIGQYIYIAMDYSKRLREYLTGLKIPSSGAPKIPGLPGYDIDIPEKKIPSGWGGLSEFATGGAFTVGGSGGSDSTPVGFMATPGETVSIGGGTGDMQNILSEVRRLVDTLPLAIADAVERR